MRISTSIMFESGSDRLSSLQSSLLKTQQQIAANRRMLTPADDPIAAARALEVTQSQSLNTQYARNRGFATDSLKLEDSILDSVNSLIQDVQTQTIAAGDATYNDTQRKYIATDLRERLTELIDLSNTKDSDGNYLFSGFKTSTPAFSSDSTGKVSYNGDNGVRGLQVGAVRSMSISDTGDAVFSNISNNKLFVSATTSTTATVSPLVITDAQKTTGHNYDVVFSGSGTTYSVYDATLDPAHTGTALATGTYTTPQKLNFDGLELTITGAPVDTDTFTVKQAAGNAANAVVIQTSDKQDLFATLSNLITALETPASSASGKLALNNSLAVANANLSDALDNVLTMRTSVGSRVKELESLDSAGDDRDLQYADTLSKLQDLDYVKAYSDLAIQKTTLDAAQQSYVKMMGISLFNYL